MSFVDSCLNCGVEPVMLSFYTTEEVLLELARIAQENEVTVSELLRIVTDDFILNTPE